MAELVLYTNPMSRGRIARWMLEETGETYHAEVLDFGTTMKAPAYLVINPMGKVPALSHGEVVVTETAAICAYLADAFPQAGLAPALAARGAYYRWLFFAAGPMESAITNHRLGFELPPDKTIMAGYGSFAQVLDTLEAAVSHAEYLAGPAFSAADLYVGANLGFLLQFGAIEQRPAFVAYSERLAARPAAIRAAALDDALIPTG
jgi:glutathione S-transferase